MKSSVSYKIWQFFYFKYPTLEFEHLKNAVIYVTVYYDSENSLLFYIVAVGKKIRSSFPRACAYLPRETNWANRWGRFLSDVRSSLRIVRFLTLKSKDYYVISQQGEYKILEQLEPSGMTLRLFGATSLDPLAAIPWWLHMKIVKTF